MQRPLAEKAGGALRYALIGAQEKVGAIEGEKREPAKIGGTTAATMACPRVTLQGVRSNFWDIRVSYIDTKKLLVIHF